MQFEKATELIQARWSLSVDYYWIEIGCGILHSWFLENDDIGEVVLKLGFEEKLKNTNERRGKSSAERMVWRFDHQDHWLIHRVRLTVWGPHIFLSWRNEHVLVEGYLGTGTRDTNADSNESKIPRCQNTIIYRLGSYFSIRMKRTGTLDISCPSLTPLKTVDLDSYILVIEMTQMYQHFLTQHL
jgi:hypothetical protein